LQKKLQHSPLRSGKEPFWLRWRNPEPNTRWVALLGLWGWINDTHWIGLKGNLNRKPWFLPSNLGVSWKKSHHPILWDTIRWVNMNEETKCLGASPTSESTWWFVEKSGASNTFQPIGNTCWLIPRIPSRLYHWL
jgi:hypothetical protein